VEVAWAFLSGESAKSCVNTEILPRFNTLKYCIYSYYYLSNGKKASFLYKQVMNVEPVFMNFLASLQCCDIPGQK